MALVKNKDIKNVEDALTLARIGMGRTLVGTPPNSRERAALMKLVDSLHTKRARRIAFNILADRRIGVAKGIMSWVEAHR